MLSQGLNVQAALGVGSRSANSRDRAAQYGRIESALEAADKYREAWKKWNEHQKKEKQSKDKKANEKTKQNKDAEKKPAEDEKKKPSQAPSARRPRGSGGERRAAPAKDAKDEGGKDKKPDAASTKDADAKDKKDEKPPKKPDRDPKKDRLVRVLRGEIPLRLEAHRSDDARRALGLPKKFKKLRLVLEGLSSINEATWDEVRAAGWPVVFGPLATNAPKPSYYNHHTPNAWKQVAQHKGLLCLATFSSSANGSARLREHAALAVAAGVPSERALDAVTINAARVLGIQEHTGSLEAGKRADLVVFGGDPLDTSSRIRMTICGGKVTFDASVAQADAQRSEPGADDELDALPARTPSRFALVGKRVLRPDGKVGPAVIRVADGEVVSVEPGSQRPAEQEVYELDRLWITPGLTAVIQLPIGGLMGREPSADCSHLRAVDAYDPSAPMWKKLIRGGFTSAIVLPGGRNPAAGQAGGLRLAATDPVSHASLGVLLSLTSASRNNDRFPSELVGANRIRS